MSFTEQDVPDLGGQVVVITGANSGIGLETADMLCRAGAHVVMACRSPEKGESALRRLREHPGASAELMRLDLASLRSVRALVDALVERHPRVDLLVNNAGVMGLPHGRTEDGFERQIGTNHLGHFALAARLFERLEARPRRVITVGSHAHRWVRRIKFDDLHGERSYQAWLAYGQSKLANMLFMLELGRRAPDVVSAAAHPGYANTNLTSGAARERNSGLGQRLWRVVDGSVAQSARKGALPTVYAAVAEDVRSGDYIGPSGLFELAGPPRKVRVGRHARDVEAAKRLWEVSEALTGERFVV